MADPADACQALSTQQFSRDANTATLVLVRQQAREAGRCNITRSVFNVIGSGAQGGARKHGQAMLVQMTEAADQACPTDDRGPNDPSIDS
jgi:hypothetical protein